MWEHIYSTESEISFLTATVAFYAVREDPIMLFAVDVEL
jgi:hypothetical protein